MPDQIQGQNQSGAQVNGQPVMGGNPYDLIDNKKQNVEPVVAQESMQNTQSEQIAPVVSVEKESVQTVVPENNQANLNNSTSVPVQNVQVQPQNIQVAQAEKPVAVPGGFTKKLISFIAKISGQPDPETGKGTSAVQKVPVGVQVDQGVAVPVGQQVGQVAASVDSAAKATNPFDSIMGGVTGFLDKVEKKVENVAGVDLDAAVSKPVEQVQTSVSVVESVSPVVTSQTVVENPVIEEKKPGNNQSIETKTPVSVEQTPVEAVKTEIESVEKNKNVPENPMSKNIQFGETTQT